MISSEAGHKFHTFVNDGASDETSSFHGEDCKGNDGRHVEIFLVECIINEDNVRVLYHR